MGIIASYYSVEFLAGLLPLTIAAYAVLPQRLRRLVLLLSSYVFFWAVSGKLVLYLLLSTLLIHDIGLWLADHQRQSEAALAQTCPEQRGAVRKHCGARQKWIATFGTILMIGVLAVVKYTPLFAINLNTVLGFLNVPVSLAVPSFMLPLGISFYTLQGVSYILDVYHRKIPADRNLLRLALYLSFFPQLMEGPICRYNETAERLWEARPITFHNLTFGLQRMLFGILKKTIVADRLNLMIMTVFNNESSYDGFVTAAAVVCYTVQLYMDFSGTMDVAIGMGEIFGVTLPENFRRPFFSKTISEFWRRWHITLGAWFRDYIYYPVSMSRRMKRLSAITRKRLGRHYGTLPASALALFFVWLCNGIWHGSGWNYIFFGMYHFVLILGGNILEPMMKKLTDALHLSRTTIVYQGLQMLRTSLLVCIGELFFRANGMKAGFQMFRKIFQDFSFRTIADQSFFQLGADQYDYIITAVFLCLVLSIGILQEKGVSLRERISEKPAALRWGIYYAMILILVVFGAYGNGYSPVDPIYAGF